MKKVFVAIPTLNGKLADATEAALKWIHLEAAGLDWKVEEFRWVGDSLIVHARNVCAAKFLETGCTDIFWLDADVGFGPGVFTRLMSYPVDFVAGIYRVKNDEERYPLKWLPKPELHADPLTGLLEVESVPFGCVRLSRVVVEKLRDACAEDWFTANCAEGMKCWPVFNTEIRERQFWGEDFYFCRRWRELGGQVWVDPELRLQHVGAEFNPETGEATPKRFIGKLGDWLRAR